MKHEQLNWVFAEAPQGSGDEQMPDLWASAASRLHKTQVKEFERFVTGATDEGSLLEAAASEFNLWVSLYKVVQNKGAPGVDGVLNEMGGYVSYLEDVSRSEPAGIDRNRDRIKGLADRLSALIKK